MGGEGAEDIGPAGAGRVHRHDRVAEIERAASVVQTPPPEAELPLTVQLVSVVVPPKLLYRPPPLRAGGVAADGAVGQCDGAADVQAAADCGRRSCR